MINQKLKEMISKLPNQRYVQEIMIFFEDKSEREIMNLSVPLLDEFEGPKRTAFIKILAKKINKHSNLLSLLEVGYQKYLVSEIGSWIKAILPKIGIEKLITSLKKQNNQKIIEMALYKLGYETDDELRKKIDRFLQ